MGLITVFDDRETSEDGGRGPAVRRGDCGDIHFYRTHDTKTHTPRARTGLSVALSALSRATRSCADLRSISVRSRARPTGSHGTMQHDCCAVAVSDALPNPMVTRTMLKGTACLSHALTETLAALSTCH